jgi:hypothetical protein
MNLTEYTPTYDMGEAQHQPKGAASIRVANGPMMTPTGTFSLGCAAADTPSVSEFPTLFRQQRAMRR